MLRLDLLLAPLVLAAAAAGQDTPPVTPEIPADTEIQTTESGLKYSVLAESETVDHPKVGDRVMLHLTNWLTDGKLVETTRRRDRPVEFILGSQPGWWDEGLTLMSPGTRVKFTVSPELAYGEKGNPPRVPPNATLIYDIEMLEITARVFDFIPFEPGKARKTDSGFKYIELEEGAGRRCDDTTPLWLDYALWDAEGNLHTSSTKEGPFLAPAKQMPLPFLKECLKLMQLEGSRYLFEVPPELAWGAQGMQSVPPNAITYWQLELVRVFHKPEFSMPPTEEVKTTPSGLQYFVIREGSGKRPKRGQTVMAHYSGWLRNGTPFDSSYRGGQPASFGLRQLIPGWREGLRLMREGSVYKFVIPSYLAYGERGSPPAVPPNATLVFHVELIQVKG